jgi:hypothetical protein
MRITCEQPDFFFGEAVPHPIFANGHVAIH